MGAGGAQAVPGFGIEKNCRDPGIPGTGSDGQGSVKGTIVEKVGLVKLNYFSTNF